MSAGIDESKIRMCSDDPIKCANNPYIVDCILKAITNKLIESIANNNTDHFEIDDVTYENNFIDITIGYPIDELVVYDIDGDIIITPKNASKISGMINSFLNFFKDGLFPKSVEEAREAIERSNKSIREKENMKEMLKENKNNGISIGFLNFLNKIFGRSKSDGYHVEGIIPTDLKPNITRPYDASASYVPPVYIPETNLGRAEIPDIFGSVANELQDSSKKGFLTTIGTALRSAYNKIFKNKEISEHLKQLDEIKNKLKLIEGKKGYDFLENMLGEKFLGKDEYKILREISVRTPVVSTLIKPEDWKSLSKEEKELIQKYTKLSKGYSLDLYSNSSGISLFYAKEHIQKLVDIISENDDDPITTDDLLKVYITKNSEENLSNIKNIKNIMHGLFTRPTSEIAEKYGYSDIYIKEEDNTSSPQTDEGKEILRQYNEYIEEVEKKLNQDNIVLAEFFNQETEEKLATLPKGKSIDPMIKAKFDLDKNNIEQLINLANQYILNIQKNFLLINDRTINENNRTLAINITKQFNSLLQELNKNIQENIKNIIEKYKVISAINDITTAAREIYNNSILINQQVENLSKPLEQPPVAPAVAPAAAPAAGASASAAAASAAAASAAAASAAASASASATSAEQPIPAPVAGASAQSKGNENENNTSLPEQVFNARLKKPESPIQLQKLPQVPTASVPFPKSGVGLPAGKLSALSGKKQNIPPPVIPYTSPGEYTVRVQNITGTEQKSSTQDKIFNKRKIGAPPAPAPAASAAAAAPAPAAAPATGAPAPAAAPAPAPAGAAGAPAPGAPAPAPGAPGAPAGAAGAPAGAAATSAASATDSNENLQNLEQELENNKNLIKKAKDLRIKLRKKTETPKLSTESKKKINNDIGIITTILDLKAINNYYLTDIQKNQLNRIVNKKAYKTL